MATSNTPVRDGSGRVIGYIQVQGDRITYLNERSMVVARVIDGKTYDANTRYIGPGDQGMRLLN